MVEDVPVEIRDDELAADRADVDPQTELPSVRALRTISLAVHQLLYSLDPIFDWPVARGRLPSRAKATPCPTGEVAELCERSRRGKLETASVPVMGNARILRDC